MSDSVFLHYTQAELDRNFDQRGWIKNAEEVVARFGPKAAATRARLMGHLNIQYGPGPYERLDVFPALVPSAPIAIFVHGGRWLLFNKDDNSFVADPLVAAGVNAVVLNFSKLPTVRLPHMVEQVRRGTEWVWHNAASFGGDRGRTYLWGHSSGSHLAGMALASDWVTRGLPADFIKGAALISGPYDMVPVMLSARGNYVKLTPAEIPAMSPLQLVDRFPCPVIAGWAAGDTDEFRRQSHAMAGALRAAGKLADAIELPELNHFEEMEALGDAANPIVQRFLKMIG